MGIGQQGVGLRASGPFGPFTARGDGSAWDGGGRHPAVLGPGPAEGAWYLETMVAGGVHGPHYCGVNYVPPEDTSLF